ncbi:MAG: iron-sulfur cluster-binding protein [Chloroflexi bacterium]|jgi:L-lactate dehydrogenase complex protein LldF|nr:MAG: iron-sulfur cluster-binding protein [Chloroflexota bacterium]
MKPDSVIIELSPEFSVGAKQALQNTQLRRNMGKATQTIRAKRAAVVGEVADWEELRDAGERIKADTMAHLDVYIQQLEKNIQAAGGTVHWASTAAQANDIVTRLIQATKSKHIIKVKSLTTDEIRLNEALEEAGITPIETDLAELIIQLAHEKSSHILVPAIHKNRSEIRELFQKAMHLPDLTDDPKDLAAAARTFLREKFMSVKVATSGANFAIAETGSVCVVESEGNGRMCLTLPDVLITVMGIEKILPRWEDLGVFMQLLPRSSTGERMNPYTSIWTGVHPGDGPQEFHIVLLDNGRTQVLGDSVGRQTLHCIRCSACINICPVYERTGGHAYGSVYPGPIGAILTPQLVGTEHTSSLPYASSLCGACYDVCPVKINIPEVLVHLRGRVVREQHTHVSGWLDPESIGMAGLAQVFGNRVTYEAAQAMGKLAQWPFVHEGYIENGPGPLGAWTAMRDLQAIPDQTFRQWWRERNRHDDNA